jgi:surface polysaccharide O-acyltransferase-like enzyme
VKNPFLSYLHNFRGFAILLIVGVHCRTSVPWTTGSLSHDLLFYSMDFSTILFVFISGYLFQYLNPVNLDYKKYLLKKLQFVILPYVIVSIPALLDKLILETNSPWMTEFYQGLPWPGQVVYLLFTGKHSGPFYFIPMMGVIFLLAPVFHRIQKSRYANYMVGGIVLVGMFNFNYGYYASTAESLAYFIPIYVFGMWASKNHKWIIQLNPYVLLILAVLYVLIFYLEVIHVIHIDRLKSFQEPAYLTVAFNWGKLKVMLLAIILLNVFYQLRNSKLSLLSTLGSYSFGIYFIHIYFINAIDFLARNTRVLSIAPSILTFTVYLLAVIMLSLGSIYIVKKIFKDKSRLLVGS